jgi:hypothetical protein
MKTVWIIAYCEEGKPHSYLCGPKDARGGWMITPQLAIRFSEQRDAENAIDLFDLPWLCRPGIEIKAVEISLGE